LSKTTLYRLYITNLLGNYQMNKKLAISIASLLCVSVAACDKKPTGQVVAVVNGEEITLQDLNTEMQAAQIPEGADKKAVSVQILQGVIDRKLLVAAAREKGLDREPAFLQQKNRMEDALLIQLSAKNAAGTVQMPSDAKVAEYIAANPHKFGSRTLYRVDQVVFSAGVKPEVLAALKPAKSLSDIATILTGKNVKFTRGAAKLDSAAVDKKVMATILALPPGEPFVVPVGGNAVASVIVGKEDAPVDPAQQKRVAAEMIRQEALGQIGVSRTKEARAAAKIEYQPGYEPKAKPANAAAPAPVANK
jgi:peptidyl-prolyl cis-trans isomerase C